KELQFFGGIKGNWQKLYNLAAINNNESPYADRLQVRMGFELPIKKDEDKVGNRLAWKSYFPSAEVNRLRRGQLRSLNIGQNKYDVKLLRQEFSRDTLLISHGFSHYLKSRRMVI